MRPISLIVASDVSNIAGDGGQLIPLVDQTRRNVGRKPTRVPADTGYASEATFEALEERKIRGYVALGREGKSPRAIDADTHPATARMARRLSRAPGKAHYRRRKAIPAPVFGWVKHVLGFRRFSMRGLDAARAEWNLVCLAVNLKRMQAMGWKPHDRQPLAVDRAQHPPENTARIKPAVAPSRLEPRPEDVDNLAERGG